MINPNQITAIHIYRISTPDVSEINVCEMDVLDDDIRRAVHKTQSTTSDKTFGSQPDNNLIRCHVDRSCVGIGTVDWSPISAPAKISFDRILATIAASIGVKYATSAVFTVALVAYEIVLVVKDDNAGLAIRKPIEQLSHVSWDSWCRISASCNTVGKPSRLSIYLGR